MAPGENEFDTPALRPDSEAEKSLQAALWDLLVFTPLLQLLTSTHVRTALYKVDDFLLLLFNLEEEKEILYMALSKEEQWCLEIFSS